MNQLAHRKLTKEQSFALRKRDNLIHWKEGGCVFIFMGKCGSTSIRTALLQSMGGVDPNVSVHADPRLIPVDRAFVRDAQLPTIAIVRRPWDRLISFWRDKVAGWTEHDFRYSDIPGLYGDMPFRVMVDKIVNLSDNDMKDTHVIPAVKVLNCVNPMCANEVIQFESLIKGPGWTELRNATNAPELLPEVMPHVNAATWPAPHIPAEAAARLRQRVFERYRADYDIWGWEV